MQDEFEGIFANATVADFMRPASVREEVIGRHANRDAFDSFVADQLRAVRTAWVAAGSTMQPLVVLATPEVQRIYVPSNTETMRSFIQRMRKEAQEMGAQWLFLAKREMVPQLGPAFENEAAIDLSDPEELERAFADGVERLGVLWYAQRRDGGVETRRHGQLTDLDGALGDPIEGAINRGVPLFARILAD